jgi:hypothetical protein
VKEIDLCQINDFVAPPTENGFEHEEAEAGRLIDGGMASSRERAAEKSRRAPTYRQIAQLLACGLNDAATRPIGRVHAPLSSRAYREGDRS